MGSALILDRHLTFYSFKSEPKNKASVKGAKNEWIKFAVSAQQLSDINYFKCEIITVIMTKYSIWMYDKLKE